VVEDQSGSCDARQTDTSCRNAHSCFAPHHSAALPGASGREELCSDRVMRRQVDVQPARRCHD
jgi:hypothetical protein